MAGRTTRNKIRHQAAEAFVNLRKAQNNLVQLAALADNRSDYIDKHLPMIVAAVEMVINTFDSFQEGL